MEEIQTVVGDSTPRTIQRYLSDLKIFLAESELIDNEATIEYHVATKRYSLTHQQAGFFSKEQALAILKILLASRALNADELKHVMDSVMTPLAPDAKTLVRKSLQSELASYQPLTSSQPLLIRIWELTEYIHDKKTIEISYANARNEQRRHIIRPLYITFSEFYFYIVGINKNQETLIFRVDRIEKYGMAAESIKPPALYQSAGELKKRIYFMYGGDMQRIRFQFTGGIIEAVFDRFPTATFVEKDYQANTYTVEVEVIGDGILLWLLSQGRRVKVLSPQSMVDKIKKELQQMLEQY